MNWAHKEVGLVESGLYEMCRENGYQQLLYSSVHPQFFWSLFDVYNNSKVISHIYRTL